MLLYGYNSKLLISFFAIFKFVTKLRTCFMLSSSVGHFLIVDSSMLNNCLYFGVLSIDATLFIDRLTFVKAIMTTLKCLSDLYTG